MGHTGGAVLIDWFMISHTLEVAAWASFWAAGAFLVIGALVAVIAFAPWPFKIVASLLLLAVTLGVASAVCDKQWKSR